MMNINKLFYSLKKIGTENEKKITTLRYNEHKKIFYRSKKIGAEKKNLNPEI